MYAFCVSCNVRRPEGCCIFPGLNIQRFLSRVLYVIAALIPRGRLARDQRLFSSPEKLNISSAITGVTPDVYDPCHSDDGDLRCSAVIRHFALTRCMWTGSEMLVRHSHIIHASRAETGGEIRKIILYIGCVVILQPTITVKTRVTVSNGYWNNRCSVCTARDSVLPVPPGPNDHMPHEKTPHLTYPNMYRKERTRQQIFGLAVAP